MNRYTQRFRELKERREIAWVPFVVLGDPTPALSAGLLHCLVDNGADMLELGIPFSDPLADGPVIQESMQRALKEGVTPRDCLEMVRGFRAVDGSTPVGLLVYANIVHAMGFRQFYGACREAGVDSVLVADVPLVECGPWCSAAMENGIAPVLICPPNATTDDIRQIAVHGRGYTYLLSRAGVTGAVAAGKPGGRVLEQLLSLAAAPPLLGFGISQPGQVTEAIASGVAGVICGSAIVKRIAAGLAKPEQIAGELADFSAKMKAATRGGAG